MAFSGPSGNDPSDEAAHLAEINVTPFIDVMLVLLIIFMVTAPMMVSGMKVDLPKAATTAPIEPVKPVVVTIGPKGELQVGDKTIEIAGLLEAIKADLAGQDRPIQVRGDTATPYGNVVAVLDALAGSGLPRYVLAFERKSTKH